MLERGRDDVLVLERLLRLDLESRQPGQQGKTWNKRDNPYTPGAERKPRTLAGRDLDLEALVSLVERLDAGTSERSLGSPPSDN